MIAHGIKDIENRTWKTKYRGRIYIHASAKQVKTKDILFPLNDVWQKNVPIEIREKAFYNRNITSAIIGEVDIIDCVINHPSIWAEKSYETANFNSLPFGEEDETPCYIYNWVLANAVLYEKPILNVKGRLSLWEYESPFEIV